MKKLRIIFLFGLFFVSASSLLAQVCENSRLNSIIKQSKKDSVQRIERLAAFKFHELINQYRVKNGAVALAWDDTLWLACRNHNLWMEAGSELSHDEKPGTEYFTGKSPGERYEFASNKQGSCSWSGENALYNWNKSGRSIDEIAANIASACFNQWKNSPGHNQNMLAKQSKVHGTAFSLGKNGRVWGTDLFAYPPAYFKYGRDIKKSNEVEIVNNEPAAEPVVQTPLPEIKVPSKKYVKLNLGQTKDNLVNALYSSKDDKGPVKNNSMEKAAGRHADYMANAKQLSHQEMKSKRSFYGETERKRMMKASHGLYFFKRYKAVESIALVETDISTFNIDSIAKKINTELNNNKKTEGKILNVRIWPEFKKGKKSAENLYNTGGGSKKVF
jgi:uncharacterized protein YkwD